MTSRCCGSGRGGPLPACIVVAHRRVEIGDDDGRTWRVHHRTPTTTAPIPTSRLVTAWPRPDRYIRRVVIGYRVVVAPGVTIGEHVTVGVNLVVCDDPPDGWVWSGPARVEASAPVGGG